MDTGEIFEQAIEHWRLSKGVGTAIIPYPLNDKLMILGILQKIYSNSTTPNTVIITKTFTERQSIIEFITQQEDSIENNNEFKRLINSGKIKVFTDKYVINNKLNNYPQLCIWYKVEECYPYILEYVSKCKFKLIILNKFLQNYNDVQSIYNISPLLEDFKQVELDSIRLSTPVEETRIGVDITENDNTFELLNYYNEYITTSINIFGSLDIMNKANLGDNQLNISSTQICYQIAKENGWNDHLDMNVEFNVQIDELYNPNSLKERASKTYEIIRERSKLLSDYNSKLDVILDIINDNIDKKILIINKRAEFASTITEFLNNMSERDICANYHDKVDNIYATDLNGNPIYYKSGDKKGERKILGAKAQKTLNIIKFNHDAINVLSTNNAPDKDLSIDVDVIIITSPMCEDINSYIYRLSKLCFRSKCIKLYSIYCKDTIEQKMIERKNLMSNHSVKNYNNENNCDFIVCD